MTQLKLNFDQTETGISLADMERYHRSIDQVVKQLATDAGIEDLFQDDQGSESISFDELNKLFSPLKG